MEATELLSILTLGLSLGLLHAFDADHIMAVSSIASARREGWSKWRVAGFCARWAAGHGATLLALVLLLLFAGTRLPDIVPLAAEKLIGVFLIVIGAWIIFSILRQGIRLEAHSHGDVTHMHLTRAGERVHDHQPVLVGITHGLAGSAPVLALIPATESVSAAVAIGYVLLFSLGVLLSMAVFGLFFGALQNWLAGIGQRMFQAGRLLVGSASIAFGVYWLTA